MLLPLARTTLKMGQPYFESVGNFVPTRAMSTDLSSLWQQRHRRCRCALERPGSGVEVVNVFDRGKNCADCGGDDIDLEWVEICAQASGTRFDWQVSSGLEIVTVLVATTAHVTEEEAGDLTTFGYVHGDTGWFFYVGDAESVPLPELRPLSAGLHNVIETARRQGCDYVLLDRDTRR